MDSTDFLWALQNMKKKIAEMELDYPYTRCDLCLRKNWPCAFIKNARYCVDCFKCLIEQNNQPSDTSNTPSRSDTD